MLVKNEQKHDLIVYKVKQGGKTLKQVLVDELNMSIRFLSKLKKDKSIFVNNQFQRYDYILKDNDIIKIQIIEESSNFEPENIDIQILYEDFDILVINKPSNIVVHPTKSHPNNTIANALAYYFKTKGENVRIRFVNRLDMNTSGLLIVAKNSYAHHILSEDMKQNKVTKKYLAVVKGVVKEDFKTINAPIYRETDDSILRSVDERGQKSITHLKTVQRLKDSTIVELLLETGRTHQIRVHLSYIGYPIIGDELYGYVDEDLIKRQALHAIELEFLQPRTKEKIHITAQIPDDMQNLINKLRK
ncbi:23S rRNA pseudouridine1911/1915/1917 synthase [Alkalithermobacter thermoalcaliphilus JW-YL-7 = DSM 7308]|uniref:Pseudouridine synthase n=1 Tax=Alkalithermobacter thermoalcaliphilus JW-YL-7 = DSM 7308 TaxID=1121328 RepID=A0A150FT63_CLOPD|nr:pseudouridine synthase, RluA family [[Clostridium] paradoxum JW-YL-7 = DSM 7308]SHK42155.1 23S rRNA pseudouridine1911/1915/1917 synthase [[Clostridium] paradoxum JW-YL-7 = DSM 7308]